MLAREIIRTCSNAHVARAALDSIGGEFAVEVAVKARELNRSVGVFVAEVISDFSHDADDDEWDGVDDAGRGADQPILSGLRYILGRRLGVTASPSFAIDGFCAPSWGRSGGVWRGVCLQ
jgi:hypothetical protein